jgi:hypothetical protein
MSKSITSLTLPAGIQISNGAFLNCDQLIQITYLGATEPTIGSLAFSNPNIPPLSRILILPNASDGFNPMAWGQRVTIMYGGQTPVVEERTETTAVVTWNLIAGAVSYYLYLYTDISKTTELAVYEFDGDGGYIGRLRSADANVPTFKIEGLSLDAEYYVEVEAVNAEEEVILSQSVIIPTLDGFTTGIKEVVNTNDAKIIGYFSIMGQRLPQAPEKGIYIIQYDNGKAEKIIKQ